MPSSEELTYGQKLIAEAIEAHFGERVVDYDEDVDDTSNHDAWEAFDAMFAAHPTPTAADTGGLVERLTAERDEMRALARELSLSKHSIGWKAAEAILALLDHAEAAEQREAAAREQIDALEQRNVETQMLAFKWMEAHDKRAAGKPYDFPTTTDVPDTIAALSSARKTIRAMREALKPFAKIAERIESEHPGWNYAGFSFTNILGEPETLAPYHAARRLLTPLPEGGQ